MLYIYTHTLISMYIYVLYPNPFLPSKISRSNNNFLFPPACHEGDTLHVTVIQLQFAILHSFAAIILVLELRKFEK